MPNLTDKQWQVIKNMLDPKERFRKYSLRSVFDGILYIVKTGVQWRMLPSDFAPWQTVYYYFSKWKNEGLLEEIFDTLRGIVRRLSGRAESPSLGIIDSRSVRTSHHIDGQRGIDVSFWGYIAILAGIFVFAQLIDNYIFQPIIYSNSVKAHPLEIFIVLLMAGYVGGVVGMLIAIPAYTVIRVFAAKFLSHVKFVRMLTGSVQEKSQK